MISLIIKDTILIYSYVDIIFIIAEIGGLFLIYFGSKRLKLKRSIEDTPTSRLKSMPVGLVEVKGQVHAAFQIRTIFTNIPCVYYRYRIQRRCDLNGYEYWMDILQGDSHQYPFFLEDESGIALILPKDANFDMPWKKNYATSISFAPPTHILEFLNSKNIHYQGIRVHETYLTENQPLYILGYAHPWKLGKDSAEAAQIKNSIWSRELKNLKNDARRLFREFDLNGDGKIDLDEWEIAKKKMAQKAKEKFQAQMHNLMQVEKGPKGTVFYISEKNEEELLSRLHKSSFFSIFGGGILSIGAIAWLLYRFFT